MFESGDGRGLSRPSNPVKSLACRKAGTIVLGAAMFAVLLSATASAAPLGAPGLAEVNARLGGLAVPFEANQGQLAPAVAYAAHTFYGTTFVTREGDLVHALAAPCEADSGRTGDRLAPATQARAATTGPGWSLVERFVGGVPLAPRGEGSSPTRVNRFIGSDPVAWQSGVPTYRRVALGRPWPGIEADVVAHGADVEKIFTVAPGTDPGRIEIGIAGALGLRIDDDGALVAETGNGPVRFAAPLAYQVVGGERRAVAVRYALVGDETYSFSVGDHDAGLPLTIDPLLQATYLGGADGEEVHGVTVDTSGNVIVAGETASTDFPGTSGGAQASPGGNSDVFVASLTSDLGTLNQATYLGGGQPDFGGSVAIDASGNVIVAGQTTSTDFPGTTGAAQTSFGGGPGDVFVVSLSPDLGTLNQASYLGGGGAEGANGVAIDTSGNVIVVGATDSTDFPGTMGGAQPSHAVDGAVSDVFVASLTADLTTLDQATYLGGGQPDFGGSVAIDASGNVIVAGTTYSTDFPGATGGAQASSAGGSDAFVASLTANLGTLNRSSYFGGGGGDFAQGLAIDLAGDVIVAGFTTSTDLPGTAGGAQPSFGGGPEDAFLANLSADLATLQQSTYLGGSDEEAGRTMMTIDGSGNVIVAGLTFSTDFPGATGGAQPSHAGNLGFGDVYLASLTPDLGTLVQATYLGGVFTEEPTSLTIDLSGNVIVVGRTFSTDFPGTTGGAQPSHANDGGNSDGFVARLTPDLLLVSPARPALEVPALGGRGLLALGGLLALAGAFLVRRAWS